MFHHSSSRLLTFFVTLSLVLNTFLWLLAYFLFPSTDTVILHYSIGVGIDFIGPKHQIYLLPAIGLIILIGNTLLGLAIKRTDIRAAWLLWSIVPLIHIILFGSFWLIWRVNQ